MSWSEGLIVWILIALCAVAIWEQVTDHERTVSRRRELRRLREIERGRAEQQRMYLREQEFHAAQQAADDEER